jgi:hypothetical protein
LFVSGTANATVIKTLNGVTYEWLELSETANTSRYGINSQLSDENSALYGYEFASRQLVSDLFLSYTLWDGLEGNHGDAAVVSGIEQLFNDFGALFYNPGDGIDQSFTTVDGYTVNYDDRLAQGYLWCQG